MKRLFTFLLLTVLTLSTVGTVKAEGKDKFLSAIKIDYGSSDEIRGITKGKFLFLTECNGSYFYDNATNYMYEVTDYTGEGYERVQKIEGVNSLSTCKSFVKDNLSKIAKYGDNYTRIYFDVTNEHPCKLLVFTTDGEYINTYTYEQLFNMVETFDIETAYKCELTQEQVDKEHVNLYMNWDFVTGLDESHSDYLLHVDITCDGQYIMDNEDSYFDGLLEIEDSAMEKLGKGKSKAIPVTKNGTYEFSVQTYDNGWLHRTIKVDSIYGGSPEGDKPKQTKQSTKPKVTFNKLRKAKTGEPVDVKMSVNKKCNIVFDGKTLQGYKKSGTFQVTSNGSYMYKAIAKDGSVTQGVLKVDSFTSPKTKSINMRDFQGNGSTTTNTTLAQSGDSGMHWGMLVLFFLFLVVSVTAYVITLRRGRDGKDS